MNLTSIGTTAIFIVLGSSATAQVISESTPAATAAIVARSPAPILSKQDFDAWMDGFMPEALQSDDVAGAVVVLVKDGQILTEKGYGFADVKTRRPVDPKDTLFRVGSISKLFTWTAVMQLVEAGKLNLDADINQYLDFKIPAREGKPITLRDLMTHTPGFAETLKHLFVKQPDQIIPLGKLLAAWVPPRIFPPGEVPAYSNYGASLAGYIVQRVSGEPFAQYVVHHILDPLDMKHSSFAQPLPADLAVGMSSGYLTASAEAHPFELFLPTPAGAFSTTGDDMARFMIAHLQDGQYGAIRILQAETAQLMHAPQRNFSSPLNPMALGFYREDRNGHPIAGHGGDLILFHADLHLLIADGVGLFVALNSLGKGNSPIPDPLLRGFMDRYYPVEQPKPLPTAATAAAHAKLMSGTYELSRRGVSGFMRLVYLLSQSKVRANQDATMTVSAFKEPGGTPIVWREVGSFSWTDPSNRKTLMANTEGEKIVNFASDELLPSVMVFQPVPAWRSSSWNTPLLGATAGLLLVTVLMWPIGAILRRHYARPLELQGRSRTLFRLTRVTALIDLVALGGFTIIILVSVSDLALLNDALDPWLRLLQLLCLLGIIGAGVSVWNALRAWKDSARSKWAKFGNTLIMLACLAFVWFVAAFHLVTPSLNY